MPDSVGLALEQHGHEVIYHLDILPEKTPDDVVAQTALANEAILVAFDADMKKFARRYGSAEGDDRFARLNMLSLECGEVIAAKWLTYAMSLVEHEFRISQQKLAGRMWVVVGRHTLRTNR